MAYNVLIVDDSRSMRKFIRDALGNSGIDEFFEAINGKEALEVIMMSSIDLIISDYVMFGMNGIEFLEIIKKNEKTEKIPFIFSSTEGNKDVVKTALGLGAMVYLLKPYVPAKISHIVELILSPAANDKENNSLVVGTSKEDLEHLAKLLADKGNFSVVAHNYEKARDFFEGTLGLIDFKVIIIMWELNVFNPFKLIKEIRHIETRINSYFESDTLIPIVLLTHAQSEAINNKLISAGFTDILNKENLLAEFDKKITIFL